MKQFTLKFLKYWLFWLLLFAFYRLVFVFAYLSLTVPEIGLAREALFAFYYALKLDLSMVGYLTIIPLIITFVWLFFQKKWLSKIIDGFTIFFIVIYSFISFGEIGIYNEWRTKLNYKALLYFEHPQEIFNSISTGTFIILLIGMLLLIAGWIWVYLKYYRFTKITFNAQWYYKLVFILLSPIFTFYFIIIIENI